MLCTLVIAIGTFPYALRAVATPWSQDQDRENIDAQAASTDGRATLYANGQTHMFERKVVIKKQRGGFKHKKTKPSIFSFPTESGIRTCIHFYTWRPVV